MTPDALLLLAAGLAVGGALALAVHRARAGDRRPLHVVSALLLGGIGWAVTLGVLASAWYAERGRLDGGLLLAGLALIPAVIVGVVVMRRA